MQYPECPKCHLEGRPRSAIRRHGAYSRTSDGKTLSRYRCVGCKKTFSWSTYNLFYRQRKRQLNTMVYRILAKTGSQRGTAEILSINRKTVIRKFRIMSLRSEANFRQRNFEQPKALAVEFDDLETFEHTKCKPLSVTLAVESETRRILGIEVSQMSVKGRLKDKALKLYGPRTDERREGRRRLFEKIRPYVAEGAVFLSDKNPHYPSDVKRYFPDSRHITFKGRRAKSNGQGELKKGRYDPLYSLNHTCAMLRANVNRLIRKTWCTTKAKDELYAHLVLYANYHNEKLAKLARLA